MNQSPTMQAAARSLAALATKKHNTHVNAHTRTIAKALEDSCTEIGYSHAAFHLDVSDTCTNPSYIIRNILLKNIGSTLVIEKAGRLVDDVILKPIAILDIAYRELQACKDMKMDYAEQRRYHRTLQYMHTIFTRAYKHMSEEQIYILNKYMDKLEEAIQTHLDILHNQLFEALRRDFVDDETRKSEANICAIHLLVDIPRMYLLQKFGTRIKELDNVSTNVHKLMNYYAKIDEGVTGDVDLNRRGQNLELACKAFHNKLLYSELVTDDK